MQPALQLALLVAILLPAGKAGVSLCARFGIAATLGELMVADIDRVRERTGYGVLSLRAAVLSRRGLESNP